MCDETPQPLGSAEEFHQMLVDLVNDHAPRRFAVCEEHGDRVDGEVFAWGMAFSDSALLVDDHQSFTGRFADAAGAVRLFSRGGRRMRLVWIDR
jgi:hypothetical protein